MSESSWERLDQETAAGLITRETIQHFRDAEQYGTAPPMEWLKVRLEILMAILQKGGTLSIQTDESRFEEIADIELFFEWLEATLPQAFEGLFRHQKNSTE